jgi:hypothetical protein
VADAAYLTREQLESLLTESLKRTAFRIQPGLVKHLGDGTGSAKAHDPADLAACLARDVLDAAPQPDASRWPMPRGELETRLSLALADSVVQVKTAGGYYIGTPTETGALAGYLADKIDVQPDRPRDPGLVAPLPVPEAGRLPGCRIAGPRCVREGGPCICLCLPEPPAPAVLDTSEYPDVVAAANILRELNALSGESGAGWDHAVNVLRFVAGHHGYELTEQD